MCLGLAMPPLQLTAQAVPKKAIFLAIDLRGTSVELELFTMRGGVSVLPLPFRFCTRVLYSKAVFILIQGDVFVSVFFSLEATWPESWVVRGVVSGSGYEGLFFFNPLLRLSEKRGPSGWMLSAT